MNRMCANIIIIFLCLRYYCLDATTDLQDFLQDFVVETRQIILDKYPHAFNPSIIQWQKKLLLSFRIIPDPKQTFTSWIGLVAIDKKTLKICGKPQQIIMRDKYSSVPCRAEDGRLITVGDQLYLIYSDNEDPIITRGGFRVYVAQLDFDGKKFFIKKKECLSSFDGVSHQVREKNWVPFAYGNKLLLAYSLVPHKIFLPRLDETGYCDTIASTKSIITWNWGILRGGTPALFDNGEYLAFFHSSKKMTTKNSDEKEMLHYFMGAYTFCAKPPFAITRISKEPIIGKNFYTGSMYKPYWHPVRVVFPCGFIFDNTHIWLTYGRQDHEMWIAKLDKKKLYESLISVQNKTTLPESIVCNEYKASNQQQQFPQILPAQY